MSLTATVVVATRDRPSDLAACLAALDAQEGAAFDVVVVDDGSATPAVAPPGRVPMRVLRTPGLGPGRARNEGLAAARGDVVLFTDDDVVVDPGWVAQALAFLETRPDHAGVEGVVRSPPWDPLYESSVAASQPGHHWTCNIAYRRSVLLDVGGFAEGFPVAHGEDRDLGARVAAIGPIGFDPAMGVTHSPRALTIRQMVRRGRFVASDIELERRHPGVFPPGRIPFSGRVMPPLRLARDWVVRARPGSPYRVDTLPRATRFALVACGQVLLAAWTAWGPASASRLESRPEVGALESGSGSGPAPAGRAKTLARRLLPNPLHLMRRRWRAARNAARYRTREVSHTYGGTALRLLVADSLAESWYDHDWPPLPELERLRDHGLVAGARVFDIGAHQGVVALMLADAVGPAGQVVAVEAEPHNVRVAVRNRALNAAANVEVLHAAGAAKTGSVRFSESLNGQVAMRGGRWGTVEVCAVTIDELATRYGPPDVAVVDVEGFEGEVLAGAARTIAERRTTFLVEVHVGHGLDRPAEQIVAAFGPFYRLLVAPATGDTDCFRDYASGADVLEDRFFLIAAPA